MTLDGVCYSDASLSPEELVETRAYCPHTSAVLKGHVQWICRSERTSPARAWFRSCRDVPVQEGVNEQSRNWQGDAPLTG